MPQKVQGPDGKTLALEGLHLLIRGGLRYSEIAAAFSLTKKQVKDRAMKLRHSGAEFVAVRGERVVAGKKLCVRCRVSKPIGDFYRTTHHRNGLSSWCKSCTRSRVIVNKYNISEEEFNKLPRTDACPLCGKKYSDTRIEVIDHDHETGRVRGVICCFCNYALGRIEDDPQTALNIHRYLKEHSSAR